MNKAGVIGGMGPKATIDFYAKIVRATHANADQDHIPLIIDIIPQIPDRTAFILGEGESPLPLLIESASRLSRSGVDVLCMPCNTAHAFIDGISKEVGLPFISIIDCTLATIIKEYPDVKNVALLATSGTIESRVYHNKLDCSELNLMANTSEFQAAIMNVIYLIKAGLIEEASEAFKKCITETTENGADIIVLGCTELPLLTPYITAIVPLIDPTYCLAAEVVKFAKAG